MTGTRGTKIFYEGVVAGLLGACGVALWFLVVDWVNGQPLLTPGALGSAVFLGAESLAEVRITAGTVLGYSLIHFSLFAIVGVLISVFVARAQEVPHLLLLGIVLFVVLETLFLGYLAIVAEFLLGNLAWWAIALGNLLAALTMGGYFIFRHPGLRSALGSDPFRT